MKVSYLIELLKMFGEDTEVYIRTAPNDLCQPITKALISIIPAQVDDLGTFDPHKILFTAFIPFDKD